MKVKSLLITKVNIFRDFEICCFYLAYDNATFFGHEFFFFCVIRIKNANNTNKTIQLLIYYLYTESFISLVNEKKMQ
jgi:hypothetical protein